MGATRAITVRLDPVDYDRLVDAATWLGIPPAVLARAYVRSHLDDGSGRVARQRGLEALDRLDALAKGRPTVDISAILEESRRELEERPRLR